MEIERKVGNYQYCFGKEQNKIKEKYTANAIQKIFSDNILLNILFVLVDILSST
jgi:hypothetical protein